MHFLLQREEISVVEKRIVRQAAMLSDARISILSLNAAIPAEIPIEAVPVGSVEFVSGVMSARSLETPPHMTYPIELLGPGAPFLRRDVWSATFADARRDLFVKPRDEIKRFTGALFQDLPLDVSISPNYPVWLSERVNFVSEWRYYVLKGQIVGAGRYDDGDDDLPAPDIGLVTAAIGAMTAAGGPAGYALDFGVLDDGRTALVEANDGWALGYYRGTCSHLDYARLLHARWEEILL